MKRRRWPWLAAALFVAGGLALTYHDLPQRYLSWRSLSRERLVAEAEAYLQNYTGGGQACLYAVECTSGRARLALIEDLDAFDIDAAKDRIWRRRFSGFCPGRTANFGLHVIPAQDGDAPPVQSSQTARWSFYHDRFLPHWGRFQGGAFSEGDWRPCEPRYAVARRERPE